MSPKKNNATMQDVARLAGVSMMTVSRVLGSEAKVRESTRKKVQEAIAELNYTPNLSARNLASSKSHLIAFLYQNDSEGYVGQLLIGAMNKAQERGYNLVLSNMNDREAHLADTVKALVKSSRVDGIIITPPLSDSAQILDMLSEINLPTVRISPKRMEYPFSFVCMDETQAAFDMTDYLAQQGHRKIACIKGHPDHSASSLRHDGFLQALREHDITIPDDYIEQGMFNYRSGFAAAEKLLKLSDRPTAIFAANDDMAAAALSAAQKHHINVPDDLSIVGFDDAPIATSIWPCLTTVRQPMLKMAETATELLIDDLQGKKEEDARRKNALNYELMVRDTVTAPALHT